MSTNDTFLAVFLGSKTNAKMGGMERAAGGRAARQGAAGNRGVEGLGRKAPGGARRHGRPARQDQEGRFSGIADIGNEMGAFTVVRAGSHEAAAKMFENHPHFTIFPGEAVEIMPVLPIPGG